MRHSGQIPGGLTYGDYLLTLQNLTVVGRKVDIKEKAYKIHAISLFCVGCVLLNRRSQELLGLPTIPKVGTKMGNQVTRPNKKGVAMPQHAPLKIARKRQRVQEAASKLPTGIFSMCGRSLL